MNWGKSIILVMTAFIGFILYMAFTLMSHKVDLQSESYYADEIDYDSEIEANQNFENLQTKPQLILNNEELNLITKDNLSFQNIEINLYRPNNSALDISLKAEQPSAIKLNKNQLIVGSYEYKLAFNKDGKKYQTRGKLIVNP
jgi:hypothetical protein